MPSSILYCIPYFTLSTARESQVRVKQVIKLTNKPEKKHKHFLAYYSCFAGLDCLLQCVLWLDYGGCQCIPNDEGLQPCGYCLYLFHSSAQDTKAPAVCWCLFLYTRVDDSRSSNFAKRSEFKLQSTFHRHLPNLSWSDSLEHQTSHSGELAQEC